MWSFLLAGLITYTVTKMKPLEVIAVAWLSGFVLMWLVIGNRNVLPVHLLIFAVPLSLIEVSVAVLIARKLVQP